MILTIYEQASTTPKHHKIFFYNHARQLRQLSTEQSRLPLLSDWLIIGGQIRNIVAVQNSKSSNSVIHINKLYSVHQPNRADLMTLFFHSKWKLSRDFSPICPVNKSLVCANGCSI
jgi:hypothetical protein